MRSPTNQIVAQPPHVSTGQDRRVPARHESSKLGGRDQRSRPPTQGVSGADIPVRAFGEAKWSNCLQFSLD